MAIWVWASAFALWGSRRHLVAGPMANRPRYFSAGAAKRSGEVEGGCLLRQEQSRVGDLILDRVGAAARVGQALDPPNALARREGEHPRAVRRIRRSKWAGTPWVSVTVSGVVAQLVTVFLIVS
jgi:hypothetical protein